MFARSLVVICRLLIIEPNNNIYNGPRLPSDLTGPPLTSDTSPPSHMIVRHSNIRTVAFGSLGDETHDSLPHTNATRIRIPLAWPEYLIVHPNLPVRGEYLGGSLSHMPGHGLGRVLGDVLLYLHQNGIVHRGD